MRLSIAIPVLVAALIAGDAALAHPGHVGDDGHGHSHWLALAIVVALGAVAAGGILMRALRPRRQAKPEETRHHG